MSKKRRNRRIFSITKELVTKSQEAALAAVQIFNSPLITFRSEIFIVLIHIAWTYLLHAYYRKNRIEYRYHDQKGKRKFFRKTAFGAYKYWSLGDCISNKRSPLDNDTKNNLFFLIGFRNEIEHQMTTGLDDTVSAKFQACCLNYNHYVKKLFGEKYAIDNLLDFSLQFSSMTQEQIKSIPQPDEMPSHIYKFLTDFENNMSEEEFNSPQYAYRVLFLAKTANSKGQADQVIEFIRPDSSLASDANKTYAAIKETERPKHLPGEIVDMMRKEGFIKFTMNKHTDLWKSLNAKNPSKGYGVLVAGKAWYWYDRWIDVVRDHCKKNAKNYK